MSHRSSHYQTVRLYVKGIISTVLASVVIMYGFASFSVIAVSEEVNPLDDWSREHVVVSGGSQADLIVRYGDVDNFGVGFDEGYDPYSGQVSATHAYPSSGGGSPSGTDELFNSSSYTEDSGVWEDGYTGDNTSGTKTKPLNMTFDASGIEIQSAILQIFVDDFQNNSGSSFQAWVNGKPAPFIGNVIDALDQTGPVGKLITLSVPAEFYPDIQGGTFEILIDDRTTGIGDGFAIDFAQLTVNPKTMAYTSIVEGLVLDNHYNKPVSGATVTIAGAASDRSYEDGSYKISDSPVGYVEITVTKDGYEPLSGYIELEANSHYTEFNIGITPLPETVERIDTQKDEEAEDYDLDSWEEDDPYEEDEGGGLSGGIIFGTGIIAGGALLAVRRGRRRSGRNLKQRDESYERSKNIEKMIQTVDPSYENPMTKSYKEELERMDKERRMLLDKIKMAPPKTIAEKIGSGIRGILGQVKRAVNGVKKVTDYVGKQIDILRNIKVASIDGYPIRVSDILKMTGYDPFKKFNRIKKSIDKLSKKNLIDWAKDELSSLKGIVRKYTSRIDILKGLKNLKSKKEFYKHYKRFNNIQKNAVVLDKAMKDPSYFKTGDYNNKIRRLRNEAATFDNGARDAGERFNKNAKRFVNKKTDQFVDGIKKGLDNGGVNR